MQAFAVVVLVVTVGGVGVLACLGAVLHVYNKYYFPRDPQRTVNQDARVIAPADGRVIYIEEVREGTIPISIKNKTCLPLNEVVKGDERPPAGVIIGIFLSPFDVHYQRSPIDGKVTEISYHEAPQNHLMTSMFLRNLFRVQPMYADSPHVYENERNVVCIESGSQTAYVVQIADQIVNRIECYVGNDESLEKGQKIGMIRAGSQVDLYLPGAKLSEITGIKVGMKTCAGETAIVE
jgi:phosphatidylserine decarboxylase